MIKFLFFIGVSAVIYTLIAIALTFSQSPKIAGDGDDAKSLNFDEAIRADYSSMPEPVSYLARDKTRLPIRIYPASKPANRTIILIHGSAWHGMQFHMMASQIAASGTGDVVVPDLRGHGISPKIRGDIDYVGQYEDDIADLIEHLQNQKGSVSQDKREIVLGGHSSGGGFVVRFMGGKYGSLVDRAILMAPFLKYDAPTTRQNSGNWAFPATRRLIGLSMLNAVGVTVFNHLPVIAFNMPKQVLDGALGKTATLQYSYALNTSMAPRFNYEADLKKLTRPFLLLAGIGDEAFFADKYQSVISAHTLSGQYQLIEGASHIGLTSDARTSDEIIKWLDQ